jgi:hypothetical protein
VEIRVDCADLRLYLNSSPPKEAIIGTCSSLSRYVHFLYQHTKSNSWSTDLSRESLDLYIGHGVASIGSSYWMWSGNRDHVDLTSYLLSSQSIFRSMKYDCEFPCPTQRPSLHPIISPSPLRALTPPLGILRSPPRYPRR